MIKLLHCSDIHLGFDYSGLGILKNVRKLDLHKTFLRIIDICKSRKIDLMLIAGDFFDNWNVSEDELIFVRDKFSQILDTNIVISAGNHDPFTLLSPYARKDFWPKNLTVLPDKFGCVVFHDLKTQVWGQSFSDNYVYESMLQKISPEYPEYLQLGVIHGMIVSESQAGDYNPMKVSDVKNSDLDYLAIGHIHTSSELDNIGKTVFAYSGCPEGRGFDELGEKGIYVGTAEKGCISLEFESIEQRQYLDVTLDISNSENNREVADFIKYTLSEKFGEKYYNNLYKITLIGECSSDYFFNSENLKLYLSEIFYIKFRDRTQLKINLEKFAEMQNLKGFFVRNMLDIKSGMPDTQFDVALKIGIKAFYGEVTYNED